MTAHTSEATVAPSSWFVPCGLDPERRPRGRINDAICGETLPLLELLHRRLCLRAENAIHEDICSGSYQGSLDRTDIIPGYWGDRQRKYSGRCRADQRALINRDASDVYRQRQIPGRILDQREKAIHAIHRGVQCRVRIVREPVAPNVQVLTDPVIFTDYAPRATLCGSEIAHGGPGSLNVTIVNHRRPQGAGDTKVSRGLHRRGPIVRVEKLILHGTHHAVLACLLEECSEGQIRVEREVALLHAREIGGEQGEGCARRTAVELDHS